MEPDNAPYSKLKTTGVGGWVDTILSPNKIAVFSFFFMRYQVHEEVIRVLMNITCVLTKIFVFSRQQRW